MHLIRNRVQLHEKLDKSFNYRVRKKLGERGIQLVGFDKSISLLLYSQILNKEHLSIIKVSHSYKVNSD